MYNCKLLQLVQDLCTSFYTFYLGQIISSVLEQIDNDCQHALTVTVNVPNNALNPHPG